MFKNSIFLKNYPPRGLTAHKKFFTIILTICKHKKSVLQICIGIDVTILYISRFVNHNGTNAKILAIKRHITGDNFMLADYLKLLKNKKNLTNQELADLSGVPVGTINRIMAGQTDNPNFQTVCDIVIALDGSLDELAGIPPRSGNPERSGSVNAEEMLMFRKLISTKDKWIHRLFICLCALILFILSVFVLDLLNPSVGFFRG